MHAVQLVLLFAVLFYGKHLGISTTSWGFHPHRLINKHAIYTLPPAMIPFYKHHINYLSEQAVAADHRRYAVAEEGSRHYIDLDYYGMDVPRHWDRLVQKFHQDSIREHGLLPWHLLTVKSRLVQAFKTRDVKNILRISADAGHYLADAHVPLHTTSNYNGQLTNQRGIHGFWETRLPELLIDDFDLWVGKASYRHDWPETIWAIIIASHQAVDSVLWMERKLSSLFPEAQKYSYEVRLSSLTRVYSAAYSRAYHQVLNRQVERRLRSAILAVGDFWYSCWVDAGQPDLTGELQANQIYHPDYQNVADSLWRQQHPLRSP